MEKAKAKVEVEVEKAEVEAENINPFSTLSPYFFILLGLIHSSSDTLDIDKEKVWLTYNKNINIEYCLNYLHNIVVCTHTNYMYEVDYSRCSPVEKHLILWKCSEYSKIHPLFFYISFEQYVCYLFGWISNNGKDAYEKKEDIYITIKCPELYTQEDICILCEYHDIQYTILDDLCICIVFKNEWLE